jgi:short-subunit dehydrogenase
MTRRSAGTAVVIGASSGIGEALARELDGAGWRVALLARRLERLEAVRATLSPQTVVRVLDVTHADAPGTLQRVLDELGRVDLVVISAGAGHNNPDLRPELDADTLAVNVLGFMTMASRTMRHFVGQGRGHLVGVTSIAALRGNAAAAYAASKAFQSVYLDGLRDLARRGGHAIVVTEVQPGGVDTAMLKPDRPLSGLVRRLLIASPEKAARQILRAVQQQKKHAYITKRYALVAVLLKLLPRPG